MVEPQPSKLIVRVRFSSPAPIFSVVEIANLISTTTISMIDLFFEI